jgi:hypothetical protein
MGLDFSNSDAHWSYSGFNSFRSRLANAIGITLNEMEGFGGSTSWATVKDDLKYFLDHSDCEGKISPKRCGKIAVRIEKIIKGWPTDDWDRQEATILVRDMKRTSKGTEPLIFC